MLNIKPPCFRNFLVTTLQRWSDILSGYLKKLYLALHSDHFCTVSYSAQTAGSTPQQIDRQYSANGDYSYVGLTQARPNYMRRREGTSCPTRGGGAILCSCGKSSFTYLYLMAHSDDHHSQHCAEVRHALTHTYNKAHMTLLHTLLVSGQHTSMPMLHNLYRDTSRLLQQVHMHAHQ